MKNNNINKKIIERYYKGQFSVKDATYLNEIFCDAGKEEELKKILQDQWYGDFLTNDNFQQRNLDHVLNRIHIKINADKSKYTKKRFLLNSFSWPVGIASTILLLLAIWFLHVNDQKISHTDDVYVYVIAPVHEKTRFVLPDGTTGWLNNNSSIRYNEDFISDREIMLTGEAFFDVAESQGKSFVVKTEDIVVEVMGTRFNITAYENEKEVEVVLETGKLLFKHKDLNIKKLMNPNDLVKYDKIQKNFTAEIVDPLKYISWIDGQLVFKNDPLSEIVRRLERWYGVEIEIIGRIDQEAPLWVTFTDESLEDALYLLKRINDFNFEISESAGPGEVYEKKRVIITLQ